MKLYDNLQIDNRSFGNFIESWLHIKGLGKKYKVINSNTQIKKEQASKLDILINVIKGISYILLLPLTGLALIYREVARYKFSISEQPSPPKIQTAYQSAQVPLQPSPQGIPFSPHPNSFATNSAPMTHATQIYSGSPVTDEINSEVPYYSEPYYVGKLGESWKYPSDHLPRGATVGNFNIAFWNILNKAYLKYIQQDTQGLRDSSILTENVAVSPNHTLTRREMATVEIVLQMIKHPTHPRSLIALEEVHPDVFKSLKQKLPQGWVIIPPPDQSNSEDFFIYDSSKFEFINSQAVKYNNHSQNTIFSLTLREKASHKTFRFVQSHIPGGPHSAEGCAKFSAEALRQYDPNLTIVLMGDMNQSPNFIQKALETKSGGQPQPYKYLPISYPSHVNTKQEASWIDNFFIYSKNTHIRASNLPEEICSSSAEMVNLFNECREICAYANRD